MIEPVIRDNGVKDELNRVKDELEPTTKNDLVADYISRKAVQTRLKEIINEMETIFADIREREVDDSVCGLCEYDCDHGLDGFANECPGFEKDDCFKLNEKYRSEWLNISNLPPVTPQLSSEPEKNSKKLEKVTTKDDKVDCEHTDCNNCVNHKYCDYEPTTKNDLSVDAVSRKEVINQIFYSTDNNGDVVLGSALRERIARLPSVTLEEPTTKNNLGVDVPDNNVGNIDCISRADVNQVIEDYMDEQYHVLSDRTRERAFGANAVMARINELPSVTPQLSSELENASPIIDWNNCHTSEQLDSIATTKNDLAVDCISRKEVDRIINKWLSHPDYELKDHIYSMTEKIHNLPSATPQEPIHGK